jgi:site-specific DNA-methyltransferase (cytosine-N4-specific)
MSAQETGRPRRGLPTGKESSDLSSAVTGKLRSVAWDFAEARTGEGLHGIHPYPAKFIPQIPRALIELFHPGDASPVLDPFCGSGTTLAEAFLLGVNSIGVDLHPLATLIAKVKTTPVGASLGELAKDITGVPHEKWTRG